MASKVSRRISTKHCPNLDEFLADQCEATRAKYAAELANAEDWAMPLDYWYAESLVYFGLMERHVETLMRGQHVAGSRTRFRKVQKTTPTLTISAPLQTEMAL